MRGNIYCHEWMVFFEVVAWYGIVRLGMVLHERFLLLVKFGWRLEVLRAYVTDRWGWL